MLADSIAVLDFETTGMSPAQQARATEIGVVIVEDGQIVARYQSLMNSGAWVPPFIEQLTGISNAMLRTAPPAAQVMQEVAEFVGNRPLLAHNASFDQKFWDAELALIRRQRVQPFACSLLLSRRLLPLAPSHKLGNLNRWAGLPEAGLVAAEIRTSSCRASRCRTPRRARTAAGKALAVVTGVPALPMRTDVPRASSQTSTSTPSPTISDVSRAASEALRSTLPASSWMRTSTR